MGIVTKLRAAVEPRDIFFNWFNLFYRQVQKIYSDPSTSRGLNLQIYLRSIQFLLCSKLL